MRRTRCKLRLTHAEDIAGGKKLTFHTQYDPSIPEDVSFSKASPSGQLSIDVTNPRALEMFEVGNDYYFDAVPCDEVKAAEAQASQTRPLTAPGSEA